GRTTGGAAVVLRQCVFHVRLAREGVPRGGHGELGADDGIGKVPELTCALRFTDLLYGWSLEGADDGLHDRRRGRQHLEEPDLASGADGVVTEFRFDLCLGEQETVIEV